MREAVRQAPEISGLVVLAAEVDLRRGAPRVARVPLDESLKNWGKPVGAALRVTTFPSRFADEPGIVQLLQGLTRDVAADHFVTLTHPEEYAAATIELIEDVRQRASASAPSRDR